MAKYYSELIIALGGRCYKHNIRLKDSGIVRAGLIALWNQDDDQFVETIKYLLESERKKTIKKMSTPK